MNTSKIKTNRAITAYILITSLFFGVAHATQNDANIVEAMQMPAWYDRGGVSYPLRPGTELKAGDVIRTGADSRALLRMAEGSIVKLGADARFEIEQARTDTSTPENVFEGLLRVVRGAFRFTTTELGLNKKRKVDVHVGAITVGIRGTDIWGRSLDGTDLFALLEGKVKVQREGEAQFTMQDPLSYVVAEQGKPTTPIQTADMDTVNSLAQETELQTGDGVLTIDGRWGINLMSLQDDKSAIALRQLLNDAGYAAEIETTDIDGVVYVRVRVRGFASKDDASSFASNIDNQYGIQQPWIVRF